MEKEVVLRMTEQEFYYLKGAMKGLCELEKKIPKKLKTDNTKYLKSLYEKIDFIDTNLRVNKKLEAIKLNEGD